MKIYAFAQHTGLYGHVYKADPTPEEIANLGTDIFEWADAPINDIRNKAEHESRESRGKAAQGANEWARYLLALDVLSLLR